MAGKLTDRIMELIAPSADRLGYELVDVEFVRRRESDSELIVYIDKDGGITLDDCESMSREIDPILDEADPIADPYVLIVSSPGLDRPLKTDRDYRKHAGEKVEVKLFEKINGTKKFTATLIEKKDDIVSLENESLGRLEIEISKIAKIKPFIEF